MDIVFLGMNDAGHKVFAWLKQREDVEVKALIEDKEELSRIKEIEPELCISAGFEHIVPKEMIKVPEKGIVNLHPSYLPYNRGSHPYIWPIVENTVAGVSIHYMDKNIDEGDIIDKRRIDMGPDDTARTLRDRLMDAQVEQFKDVWPEIKKGVRGEKQDPDAGNVHYRKELDEIAEIDLNEKMRAGKLIDKLRGLTYPPEKLAWFEKDGKKYYIEVDITPEDEL